MESKEQAYTLHWDGIGPACTATPNVFRPDGVVDISWQTTPTEERVREIVREELAALGLLPK